MNGMEIKQVVYELERRLLDSEVRTNPEVLSNLLADDFVEFGSSGKVWVKADCLRDGGIGEVKMSIRNFQISPLAPDVVLVTYQALNEENRQRTLRSSIWTYRNNRWQLTFHQGTKTDGL